MSVKPSHYEALLAEYSSQMGAIALLKQHRPYLELIPSLRRPDESIIAIPLPLVRINQPLSPTKQIGVINTTKETICLACDVAVLMCDPEWKIKTGVEILVFIHRPQEDFSDLLSRWRQTQVLLERGYEWVMPSRYKHVLSEEAENIHPLFVVFAQTPERIIRGLSGAYLPFVVQNLDSFNEEETPPALSSESPAV
ncbi:hypothetical protein H6S82_05770 [Planktothrix sp. FACHB-1355]|uniref:Type IV pilin PilA n=1 Tax=Aerosakkonema funiforme FACHB-1375 TaxID=2949571 RepID=A0A926VF76_9CYAN|nr:MULTISPECIES: hypothetical protein [Oscillatoriales]MBD2182657.1 hypothetical protein [Aerosakkonema funiforme FACHB-1375]MBD3558365.1 hypothetical protein [Planktothrix sp. FACHB-1355]